MMSPSPDYQQADFDYQFTFRSGEKVADVPKRQGNSTRFKRASRPKSFNGIHRRRAKRITW